MTSEEEDTPSNEFFTSDDILSCDEIESLLGYLKRFEYASFNHVLVELAWETGARLSGLRALDIRDFNRENQVVKFVSRQTEGTRLQNIKEGERQVSIPSETATTVQDYIDNTRYDVHDEYGRKPLLTTQYGRPSKTTLRNRVYSLTQPCTWTDECPHDRDMTACDAAINRNHASKCPSSVSPHAIRKGSIEQEVKKYKSSDEEPPVCELSDLFNVSPRVLKDYFDARSEEEIL